MNFESEKILLDYVLDKKSDSFDVEDNIIIPDIKPDILSVVSSCGNAYVYKKEMNNGKLKIDGGVLVDIMYIADDEQNSIRAVHGTIDFSKNIDMNGVDNCNDFNCNLKIKAIEPKILNGRKISLKVSFSVNTDLFINEEKQYIKNVSSVEDIQMISDTVTVNSMIGCGETTVSAKDTVSITDDLADILSTNLCIKNRDIKISYNKVLSKADLVICILYITEQEQIKMVKAEVPVMGFIDIPGISDEEICVTNYEIRNINIKPNNVEEHSVFVDVEVNVKCKAYATKEINLIQDLYSPNDNIIINQSCVSAIQNKNVMHENHSINEKLSIADLKENLIYDVRAVPNIVKQNNLSNCISYECELMISVLYQSAVSNKIEVKNQTIAFQKKVECATIEKESVVDTSLYIEDIDFSYAGNGVIEVNTNVNFRIESYNKKTIDFVSGIKVEKLEQNDKGNSLVIYYVKEGDTLWKIAKKFRSTVDEIAEMNGIENVDKIGVGDQLFIPRYVSARV